MRLLLETLRIDQAGVRDLERHTRRLNQARRILFGAKNDLDLSAFVSAPRMTDNGPVKCRVICGLTVERVEYQPYRKPSIRSLRLVRADDLDYRYKYADRAALDRLRAGRGAADDILIVQSGFITDVSFANVVFFDGRRYVTPHRPLLEGTRRRELLERGAIEEDEIRVEDVERYARVFLINSLLGLEDDVSLPVSGILFA